MSRKKVYVTKMSGEPALFDEKKLRQSLFQAGADKKGIDKIIRQIKSELYDGISTERIHKMAVSQLQKRSIPAASRYKLKKAIFELGPTGFPFEKYMGELLRLEGYTITIGSVLQGHCIKHEVDIIAEKDNQYILLECKFHSMQGQFCNVKNPLYINARFRDIEVELKQQKRFDQKKLSGGLITNTRFSSDALQYGNCVGMFMLSWDHPVNNGIKQMIDKHNLYPITGLMTLTKYEKNVLLNYGIILCKQLPGKEPLLRSLNFSETRIPKIIKEARNLDTPLTKQPVQPREQ
jgi:hypothetical protein